MTARFVRLGEFDRPRIRLEVDGRTIEAKQGDTLMVAILTNLPALGESDFDQIPRAGFCLMGACQDCWVWTRQGMRLQACSVKALDGMKISTSPREATWSNRD